MPLILKFGLLHRHQPLFGGKPNDTSNYYLQLYSEYLSEAYHLTTGDIVVGRITGISGLISKQTPPLPVNAEFVLETSGGFDHLFLSLKDFELSFRDYGIVQSTTRIAVSFSLAFDKKKNKIEIYPHADVEA